MKNTFSVIDCFIVDTTGGNYPWKKGNILSLINFCVLDQIPKIKILYKVTSKHPKLIYYRRQLISIEVLNFEGGYYCGLVDDCGSDFDEED